MNNSILVGDKVEYIGVQPELWRKQGIVVAELGYNSIYNYTAFFIDFDERINVVVAESSLLKINK